MDPKLKEMIDIWRRRRRKNGRPEVHSDVLGSYTGTPEEEDDEVPVQDADDL